MASVLRTERVLSAEPTAKRTFHRRTLAESVTLAWRTIVSRSVGSDRRIPVPDDVVSLFTDGEPTGDERLCWSVAHDDAYLVVSDTPLQKSPYEFITNTALYDGDGTYRIRPPERIPTSLRSIFYEGNEVLFLVSEEMAAGSGPNSTFLLSQRQAAELLPGTDRPSDLGEQILDTPGFVPPPG